MIFISIDDFYEKASKCRVLTREEEIACAKRMKDGDLSAREQLIESYTPMAANHVKRAKPHLQQMGLAVYCMQALEKAVDSFDFMTESETFAHRLNWRLRQATVDYIVK